MLRLVFRSVAERIGAEQSKLRAAESDAPKLISSVRETQIDSTADSMTVPSKNFEFVDVIRRAALSNAKARN